LPCHRGARVGEHGSSSSLTVQGSRIPYNRRMADSLGNAFHRLRAYLHPHVKHVITQTLEQGDEVDFVGSEQNLHIHRQVVKIQRGEQVDQVTALLPKVEG
jgi:hypothetical protein